MFLTRLKILENFQLCNHVLEKLQTFSSINDIEVQERANSACILIEMLRSQFHVSDSRSELYNKNQTKTSFDIISTDDNKNLAKPLTVIPTFAIEIVQEMALLFDGELIPVAPKAQRKVPLPEGLDLDEWINGPPEDESSNSSQEDKDELFISAAHSEEGTLGKRRKSEELTPEQIERNRMARLIEQSHNPHYLKSLPSVTDGNKQKPASASNSNYNVDQYDNIDDIPISELSLDVPLQIGGKLTKPILLVVDEVNIMLLYCSKTFRSLPYAREDNK